MRRWYMRCASWACSWWVDARCVLGVVGDGCAIDGDVLCGGALSLRDGGCGDHGVSGRAALLVAEDDGAHVSGAAGEDWCGGDVLWVLLHVRAAVYFGVYGDAAAVCDVSDGVAGVECVFDGGRDGDGFGYLITMVYLAWSLRYGKAATANPWRAYGLEWQTSSPPPTVNFLVPVEVTHEAYDYESMDKPEVVVVPARALGQRLF